MPILLVVAFLGCCAFIGTYTKVREGFAPIVTAAGACLALYVAGLFGDLRWGLYAVISLGIAGLVISLFRFSRLMEAICNAWPVILFLVLAVLYSIFITLGIPLDDFDDPVHWYRIVKALYADNTLPTTPEILFRTYVPGSALWIYLTAQITGLDFARAMLGQQVLYAMCVASLLSVLPRDSENRARWVCLGITILACTLLYEQLYQLSVDALVGLVPMAAAILLCTQKEHRFGTLLLLSAFTGLIKRSGLLFCALLAVFYLLYEKTDEGGSLTPRRSFGKWLKALLILLLPVVLSLLYRLRANAVYGGELGLQSGTLERYRAMLSQKGLSDIAHMALDYLKKLFDLGSAEMIVRRYWAAIAFLLVLMGVQKARGASGNRVIPILLVTTFLTFNLGLFATYVFSMDQIEGTNLVCFERYFTTLCVFSCGLILCDAITFLQVGENPRRGLAVLAFLVVANLFFVNGSVFFGEKYDSVCGQTYRTAMDSVQECFQYDGKRVLVLYPEKDDEFYLETYMMSYLRTDHVTKMSIEEAMEKGITPADTDADYAVLLGYAGVYGNDLKATLPMKRTQQWGLWRIER